jgi:hypothetical protein
MNSTCTQTTFSEAFPDIVAMHQRRLLLFTGFMILVLIVMVKQIHQSVFADQLTLASFIILWTVCMLLWFLFFVPYQGQILGKEGVLTILDQRHILKPGDRRRLWYYPRMVETIPLEGSATTDFSLVDLIQFHDLDDFIPGLDCTQGTNMLSVSVQYAWSILPAEAMDPFYFRSTGVFHSTIDTLIKSKFVQSLHLLCHNGPALSQAEQSSFSDVLEDILSERVAVWEGVHEQHPCPFHLEIRSLSIELVSTTTKRTVL